jgi:broad specificity phosphatase PhoE
VIVGIRHARVWNPEGLVYARLPGFHLSEAGRAETEALARGLAAAPLAAVYASPLERAAETAAILARPHGLEVSPEDRLTEWSFWVRWQGMPWSRIRELNPELLDVYGQDPERASPDDPLKSLGERVLEWAADAERDHPGGLVIGVTHEAPLLAGLLVGRGQNLSGYRALNLPHLGSVRLRPGPPEVIDLMQWASGTSC